MRREEGRFTTVSVIKGVGVQDRGVGGGGAGLWVDIERRERRVPCRSVCRSAWEAFMVGRGGEMAHGSGSAEMSHVDTLITTFFYL